MKPARYKHSPSYNGYGAQMGGDPNCAKNICACDYMASYDIYDQLLVPMSGGSYYWSNNGPPMYIHRSPCCFDVTIAGFSSKSINESWCQDAENINGSYVSNAEENCAAVNLVTCPNNCLVYMPLCSSDQTDSTFSLLKSYLVLGIDNDTILVDSTVYPNGSGPNIIYYRFNYNSGGISLGDGTILTLEDGTILVPNDYLPQLYIWAITELHLNINSCNCLPIYYFKTKIGEFNGDYYVLTTTSPPTIVVPSIEDCGTKYYHGDFDGRYLEYTVDEGDLWRYTGKPTNYYYNGVQPTAITLPEICNFGTINIKYRTSQTPHDLTSTDSHLVYISAPIGPSYTTYSTSIISAPAYLSLTLGGITSVNPLPPESGDITACSGCEELNAQHRLSFSTRLTGHTDVGYYKYLQNICCDCQEDYDNNSYTNNPSGICLEYMTVSNEVETAGGQYANVISCEIYGSYFTGTLDVNGYPLRSYDRLALYQYHYYDWQFGVAPDLNLHNVSLDLPLISADPVFTGVCSFANSTANVVYGEGTRISCVPKTEICSECHDRKGPENIQVIIPNGWVDYPRLCNIGYYATCSDTDKILLNGTYITSRDDAIASRCGWYYMIPESEYDWRCSLSSCSCLPCCIFPEVTITIGKICADLTYTDVITGITTTVPNTKYKYFIKGTLESYGYASPDGCYYNYGYGATARVVFGTLLDPADYGISIICDPQDATCECDQYDLSILGGQYINCNFNGLILPFLYHACEDTRFFNWWSFPIKWNGTSALTITSL